MLQQRQLHFCTEQIMAVLWSLTCAAVMLPLLQEKKPFYQYTTQGKISNRSITVSRNLRNAKNYFIDAKIYKLTE